MSQLMVNVLLLSVFATNVAAYSYSEAGSEPLFDGREALTSAMIANDKALALATLTMLKPTLLPMEEAYSIALISPLTKAIENGQRVEVIRLLNRAFAAEIKLRLTLAEQHLNDYQKSKVLVVKSKRFLDMLLVDMDEDSADAAEAAMDICLQSLGNPGVFGVGKVPANAEQFNSGKNNLFESLSQF